MPKPYRRITSRELVEIRTVLSRARTALSYLDHGASGRLVKGEDGRHKWEEVHTLHEKSMMRDALNYCIDILEMVEKVAGYREAE